MYWKVMCRIFKKVRKRASEQERERKRGKQKKRQARRVAFVCCSLCTFISFVELCFMAARPEPPREKGWTDAGVERKTRHCLTKLRGIKFAFYCARFLNASFYRGRGKLPSAIATIVRGGNSPISFRDMNTTSPFDPLVGSHGESISRIEIHTRV